MVKSQQQLNKEALERYYKNRDKKIEYQRNYDRTHKDKKLAYDRIRRLNGKNEKRAIQNYSKNNYFELLFGMYKGCQKCGSKEKLQIHHINYTHELQDCMLLCQDCHKKIHRKYNQDLNKDNSIS